MSTVFRLPELSELADDQLQEAIDGTRRVRSLRDGVVDVIEALHGLPDVMNCDLKSLHVYVGRAGATAWHLRQRWGTRFGEFDEAPSTCAAVVMRGRTQQLMEEGWESAAQRLVNLLREHRGLCCSNAVVGNNGRRPDTDDTVIYLVARTKRGPVGAPPDDERMNGVLMGILEQEDFDANVARAACLAIARPEQAAEHELAEPWATEVESQPEQPLCKECEARAALQLNRGYCGWCRRIPTAERCRAEGCRNRRREGNRGFCGHHRGRG
jgi:hypothetical protein